MNIETMSYDELKDLNEAIVARMRQLRAAENAAKITTLVPGLEGYYVHKGFQHRCRILKVLRTNIDILDLTTNKQYRMPASMFNRYVCE